MYRELLLGCGHKRDKRLFPDPQRTTWENLITVDSNEECLPTVIADLFNSRSLYKGDLIEENSFDEIHAYEVLEHIGNQGDFRIFFFQFETYWHILKPGGFFCATVPSRYSPWLWGDPGHSRAILPETLTFLHQPAYAAQIGKTSMSDYRKYFKADFDIVRTADDRTTHSFILRAVKPARIEA